jgi:acetyl-CoA synthetase
LYWFRGDWHTPEWTARRFIEDGKLYLTGDAASMDADGYVFFSPRGVDIINSAGHRVGAFEIESSITAHSAVAEAAAIGMPDELRGEVVKAFFVLKPGHASSAALAAEVGEWVKSRLSAQCLSARGRIRRPVPKTPSGKVQRYLLRQSAIAAGPPDPARVWKRRPG